MKTNDEVSRLEQTFRSYLVNERKLRQWSKKNLGNRAILSEWKSRLRQTLNSAGFLPLDGLRIVDIGCGAGSELVSFVEWGALQDNVYGIDLLPERIEEARNCLPRAHFQVGNAEVLDFADSSFDIVLLITVFTSILAPKMSENISREVRRILRPGGAIVWYDFRFSNPANRNVHGIGRREIAGLFPDFDCHLQSVTLLPPLARRMGPFTSTLYPLLAAAPFLRTHYLGLLVKPQ